MSCPVIPASDLTALERSALDLNDLGNARRAISYARGRLFWIEDKGLWLWFDGRRFSADYGKAAARSVAIRVADGMKEEVLELRNSSDEARAAVYGQKFTAEMAEKRALMLWDWSVKSGESAKANAMLEQAKGLTADNSGDFLMQAQADDFDVDPLAYHCANGVIRFGQGEDGVWRHSFTPGHHPEDLLRQISTWCYDPDAQAPHWAARLDVMQPDALARTALQRIYGMTLTGLIDDQAFYIFQGKGQDGKSTTNEIVAEGHGDYFRQSGVKTFLDGVETSSGGAQTDLVRLGGDVRMVVCDEPKPRSTWNGERIKQFTGSKMTARGAYERSEETFTPRGKLIVECNQLPRPPSDDRGFRRRHKIIPFAIQFGVTPGVLDEPVSVVKRRLQGELPGILNWMIAGALEWLNDRVIPEPLAARQMNESYWSGASVMADFLKDCCDISDPAANVGATDLYEAFRAYRVAAGDDEKMIMKQTSFGNALTNMQLYVGRDKASGRRVRLGIRLRVEGVSSGASGPAPAPEDDVPGWDAGGQFDG